MKRKIFVGILAVEAIVCLGFSILAQTHTSIFSAVLAFPFEQIGLELRRLSLSGGLGNALAIVIYLVLSLLPILVLLLLRIKRRLQLEDSLLLLLSLVLFTVLYLMINPASIVLLVGSAALLALGKAVLGSVVYSVLAGYLILRLLRLFSTGGTKKLLGYMSIMLHLLAALYVYLIASASVSHLLDFLADLKTNNSQASLLSSIFLILQFLVDILPYALSILIVWSGLNLLDELGKNHYSATAVMTAERLAKKCTIVLGVTVLANLAFNLLQLLFIKQLRSLHSTVQLPIFAVIFVLATLLLTRFISESKQLKDDQDLFV